MARSVMYRFGDGTKEWHAQTTATFFSPPPGKLTPGMAVNKINIHKFYCLTFPPPMCVVPRRAANFYSNLPIDYNHKFVSEEGVGRFVFASCVCDVRA